MNVEDQTLRVAGDPGFEELGRRGIREDSEISGLQEARQCPPDGGIIINDRHEM
jgi:hypothetical protein